jgi:hypothetical protein
LPDCFLAAGSHRPASRPAARAIWSVRTTLCYQKSVLVPSALRLYNQGNIDFESGREPLALWLHLLKWIGS